MLRIQIRIRNFIFVYGIKYSNDMYGSNGTGPLSMHGEDALHGHNTPTPHGSLNCVLLKVCQ